ncbi:MAG: SPOR domain-containing protein [Deltaproteobacteria bacterium]|nr:SPOR domain-containing protein [Deltaproteobacteria bacterium]
MSDFKEELEEYFCKFTFGQFMTLAVLELATLFFVFYLGARYGPELIGSQKPKLSFKEETPLPSDEPRSVDEIVGKGGYSYPELLTDGKAKGTTPPEATPENPVRKAEEIKKSGETTQIIGGREMDKSGKEIPTIKKEPMFPQTVRVKSAQSSKFTVQVGSFPSPEEASNSVEQWKKKGYDSFMSIAEIPNKGTWYRVRVGSFGNRQDAQNYVEQLKKKERVSALVVLNNS